MALNIQDKILLKIISDGLYRSRSAPEDVFYDKKNMLNAEKARKVIVVIKKIHVVQDVSYDNRLCNAYLSAGRGAEFLDILVADLNVAVSNGGDEVLNVIQVGKLLGEGDDPTVFREIYHVYLLCIFIFFWKILAQPIITKYLLIVIAYFSRCSFYKEFWNNTQVKQGINLLLHKTKQ